MTFQVDFPQGDMEKTPGNWSFDLRDWTAKGVVGTGILPDGSKITITIPDTYAHVEPIKGTGTVGAFSVQCEITPA